MSPDRPLRLAAAALASSLLAFGILCLFAPPGMGDFKIYRLEGSAIRHGLNLYGHLPGVHGLATYPPFAAIVFVPASLIPLRVASVLMVLLTLATLVWVGVASARLAGAGEKALQAGFLLAAVGLWSEPVFKTLGYGQINLMLLALVLWDFTRPEASRWRGIGVGLAAAIKVTPGIFIVYLLITRRWRFAATATGTFAVTLALSCAVDASATWNFWTKYLRDPHRVGRLENSVNQTVRGFLVRLDGSRDTPAVQLILVAVVLLGGLTVAAVAHRKLGDRWGLPAAAVTGLLASPIAWSHHWVWYVPLLALLWFEARRWVVPTFLVFQSFVVWAVPHGYPKEFHLTGLQIAMSNWYVVFGVLFLVLVGCRTRDVGTPSYEPQLSG